MSVGAITLADLTSADWSLMLDSTAANDNLGTLPGSGIGNVVQALDDVDQCIHIICTTPPGSDPLRPTFAADIFSFIDLPIDIATANIVRDLTDAITKWEPRVTVESIAVAPVLNGPQAGAQVIVTITWRLNIAGTAAQQRTTIVTLASGAV